MSGDGKINDFTRGLEVAADYLERTADDYRQMASTIKLPGPKHYEFARKHREQTTLNEKADLLYGQAQHIRNMKK